MSTMCLGNVFYLVFWDILNYVFFLSKHVLMFWISVLLEYYVVVFI